MRSVPRWAQAPRRSAEPAVPRRGPRGAARALVGLASSAGLAVCATALLAPASLERGLPVLLLFYPLLWAIAIGAVLRARRG